MNDKVQVAAAIRAAGVVGIVRAADAASAESTARTLLLAGLPVVEVSLVTPGAVDVIARLATLGQGVVGAGTVLDVEQVRAVHEAGARFVVSPVFLPEVISVAGELGLVTLPGVGTPTEAVQAMRAGADFVKLFPAGLYGPGGVRGVLSALPWLPLVPTGGVSLDAIEAYTAAGSAAVGLGSSLSTGSQHEVARRITAVRRSVAAGRDSAVTPRKVDF